MGFAMFGNVFSDLDNWIRGWDSMTFAIVTIVLVSLLCMYGTSFLKGLLGGKFKFKFFSFIFLALVTTMLVYICIKH